MSALPNFTNFAFCCGQGVPSDWTDAHVRSLYDSILADPIQHTKDTWTPAHIWWVMKSIWFCDKTSRLSRVTGMDASILQRQRATIFRRICLFVRWFCHLSIQENTVHSPTFWQDLSNVIGEFWLATSDPVSSDMDTGVSNEEGNNDKDVGYRAAQSPAHPMDIDPIASEGKPGRNKVGEEWQVASEMRADLAQAAATLAGLVAYGTSSDNASGDEEEKEEEEKKVEGEEDKTSDTDNEREEEEEWEEHEEWLNGREVSDSTPKSKVPWVKASQPAMRTHMLEMEEEGVLEQMRSATAVMAGAIVSCQEEATIVLVPCLCQGNPAPVGTTSQPEVGPSSTSSATALLKEYNTFTSCPMQHRPPLGHDAVINFAFNLEEHCAGGLSHPREVAWDQILTLTHQLVVAYQALKYELRRSGPFSNEEVDHFLQTRYPNSMLPADEDQPEGNTEGKGDA
ncbi:hypothetical protein ARMGADRAFT_1088300 [Armillaria gallica]|uniref:Uncharacterized protein n=1 Tax=Armillaria gallica TaxID=47427 RepID=A0A2H3CN60_ARMGA|nr:hypothetical protein ARMGADRAFT_1088300 [Armillaria gallica]